LTFRSYYAAFRPQLGTPEVLRPGQMSPLDPLVTPVGSSSLRQ